MKHLILSIVLLSVAAFAQANITDETIVARDTIEYTAYQIDPELDYNAGHFIYTLYGVDQQDKNWRSQLNYRAEIPYGEFSDDDFALSSGGKNYNYIRPTNNPDKFYSYQHLDASIANDETGTTIEVNGLINDLGTWRRVLIHGFIPNVQPLDTVDIDFGHAYVTPTSYVDVAYCRVDASNADYTLTTGIMTAHLEAKTYYTADMLLPELVTSAGDTIAPKDVELVVSEAGDFLAFDMNLLSEEQIIYHITFDNNSGAIIVTDTTYIDCNQTSIENLTEMYGMYQILGQAGDTYVSLAVRPEVIEQSLLYYAPEDFNLTYTFIANLAESTMTSIASARAILESIGDKKYNLTALLMTNKSVCYKVTMPVGYSILPEAVDTINVDFGNGVGRVEYTHGMGYVGFVLSKEDDIDIHFTFYNGYNLSGTFGTEYFVWDDDFNPCYVTTYMPNGLIKFSDLKAAQVQLDSVGDVLHITLDCINLRDTLYHCTAQLDSKTILRDTVCDVSTAADYSMVAYQYADEESPTTYRMQLQHVAEWDEDGNPLGDYEVWDFRFMPDPEWDGIQGEYGYSEGNMQLNEHIIVEGNTEILLKPVAGTLTIVADEKVDVLVGEQEYTTHLYSIDCEFVAENLSIYTLVGENMLECVNVATGELVELSEDIVDAIVEAMRENGTDVQKVMRNGQLVIISGEQEYSVLGYRLNK